MRVNLLFEDGEQGTVIFRADFINGKREDSNAHNVAAQVIKFLDDQAESKLESLEETVQIEPSLIVPAHG